MCEICFKSLNFLRALLSQLKLLHRRMPDLCNVDDIQALRQIINRYEINLFYIFIVLSCLGNEKRTFFFL